MSDVLSLLLIRLELGDSAPLLDLTFQSSATFMPQKKRSLQGKNQPASKAENNNKAATDETIKLQEECIGERLPAEITVETYESKKESVSTYEENNVQSSTSHSESSSVKKDETTEKVEFFSGNPFVEKTQGVLHIYKQNEMVSLTDSGCRSEMLCMLAVPAIVTCRELLQFLFPVGKSISQMRIIRDQSPNQYMVLVKFRSQDEADNFYRSYNGSFFNSIEENVCHLVYVGQVETMKESEGASLPVEGHIELPTCPVCLERMDESVDGVLTILCNHSFHGACLSQWGDTSCPVCRFCQTPELIPEQKCTACGKQTDLWICLICGYIGCGRYAMAHAHQHFQETSHTFALQVGGQRVWDYAGDNYVHRLIQSKNDGKVVEFEPQNRDARDIGNEEKIEAITLEYTYLLTNQLESQRMYFEEKLAKIEKLAQAQIEDLESQVKRVVDECQTLKSKFESVNNEKVQIEKKSAQSTSKLQKMTTELKDEQQMNKFLRQDQQKWSGQVKKLEDKLQDTIKEKDKKITDLEEQLRDLMFHFEAESKLKEAGSGEQEDIREGQLFVAESNTPTKGKKKKK